MSNPINSSLQNINSEIQQLVSEANGGQFNESNLFQTESNIQQLLKQKDLPPSVREKLNAALNDLKGSVDKNGAVNMSKLFQASEEIQQAEGPPS